jgi:hypothetical protein
MEYHETIKLAAKRADWVGRLGVTLRYFSWNGSRTYNIHVLYSKMHPQA